MGSGPPPAAADAAIPRATPFAEVLDDALIGWIARLLISGPTPSWSTTEGRSSGVGTPSWPTIMTSQTRL